MNITNGDFLSYPQIVVNYEHKFLHEGDLCVLIIFAQIEDDSYVDLTSSAFITLDFSFQIDLDVAFDEVSVMFYFILFLFNQIFCSYFLQRCPLVILAFFLQLQTR